jgi:hypothetical protein
MEEVAAAVIETGSVAKAIQPAFARGGEGERSRGAFQK